MKFKIEEYGHTREKYYRVYFKNWLPFWRKAYVYTDYFCPYYKTIQDAKNAIKGYKNRFTEVVE